MEERIYRKKRNGRGAYINVDFSWKPELLQKIYNEFKHEPFTIKKFVRNCCIYTPDSKIPKLIRRIYLLKKTGWLNSKKKTVVKGMKKRRVFKLGRKAENYRKNWGYFNNEKAPLYTKRWFNKPKIIEIEKEVPVVEERHTSREIKPVEEV